MPKDSVMFANDREGVSNLREQVGSLLKVKIVEAIHQDDVATIKKIACLFKSVEKQDEGMRHYTGYVLQHKTLRSLDAVIKEMYVPKDSNELVNWSESFAKVHHCLLACISDHSETILQLFDLDALTVFLKEIDKVAKEKGTQVIEHFRHANKVDQMVRDLGLSVSLTSV